MSRRLLRKGSPDLVWPWSRSRQDAELLTPQDAYALWASSYPPRPHNKLMEAEQAAVVALLPDLSGCQALDAGCGTGRYLRVLADRGATVTGVDLSAPMLAHARASACLLYTSPSPRD